jgi:uncharacterized protein YjbJ (UPF0337 family)
MRDHAAAAERSDEADVGGIIRTKSSGAAQVNWDQIAGNWKQFAGRAKEQWGKLTNDDWDVIAGKRDQLVGKIQERYGKTQDEAEREVAEYERTYRAPVGDD